MTKQRIVLAYGCLVGIPLVVLIGTLQAGQSLTPPDALSNGPDRGAGGAGPGSLDVAVLILQVAVIIAASRLAGWLFQTVKQPAAVGEMFSGIMLGPSLFGWIAPQLSASLLPSASLGPLSALSQLGVVIYMFLVGLRLNHDLLKAQTHTAVLTSHVSIVVSFLLGSALALVLYPLTAPPDIGFTGFALAGRLHLHPLTAADKHLDLADPDHGDGDEHRRRDAEGAVCQVARVAGAVLLGLRGNAAGAPRRPQARGPDAAAQGRGRLQLCDVAGLRTTASCSSATPLDSSIRSSRPASASP